MKRIYLDNAATTAVAPEVRQVMDDVHDKYFGNPSSIHSFGQEAKTIVDKSRRAVSSFVGCGPEEIIFTSGGSESDNLAIRGIVESEKRKAKNEKPHIITSAVEHYAVLHTVLDLEKEGLVEATYIKPDSKGLITPEMVKNEIKENTLLVSIIYVNNEIGVLSPIKEIGDFLKVQNEKRKTKNLEKIYFHTDAVQAAEFFDLDPAYLGVDLLTSTGHKIHGPKGIGVLYAKGGISLKPQIVGGAQEFRNRAGTENVAGMAGLAKAVQQVTSYKPEVEKIKALRDKLEEFILKNIPETYLNGAKDNRAPHISNISFKNAEGEAIILNLDFFGIAVSSGSACTSRSLEPSHVLLAMGVPPEKAHGSVRFSLSRYTQEKDIDKVLDVLPGIIEKLRVMSPFKNC